MATTSKPDSPLTAEARANALKWLADRKKANPNFGGFDSGANDLGWTVQQGPQPALAEDIPGAVFTPEELPDFDKQIAAGINPGQQNYNLVVAKDEAERAVLRGEVKEEDN